MDIVEVITNPLLIFWSALVLVVATIIVLVYFEKKLKQKIDVQKKEESYYTDRIINTRKLINEPKSFVFAMNDLTREFLNKEFGLGATIRFSEVIEFFKKQNRPDIARFCETLQESLYSGTALDPSVAEYLMREIVFMIKKQKKISDDSMTQTISEKQPQQETQLAKFMPKLFAKKEETPVEKQPEPIEVIPFVKQVMPTQEKPKEQESSKTEEYFSSTGTIEVVKPKVQPQLPKEIVKPERSKLTEKQKASQQFVKSFDNLDRVKSKLLRSGKALRF